jgi:hypothetical protein
MEAIPSSVHWFPGKLDDLFVAITAFRLLRFSSPSILGILLLLFHIATPH